MLIMDIPRYPHTPLTINKQEIHMKYEIKIIQSTNHLDGKIL